MVVTSMKDAEYDTILAMTIKGFIATKYLCHSAGHDEERVVCVHSFLILYQLAILLGYGLVEHVLVEICSQWSTELEDLVNDQGGFDQIKKAHNGESIEKINTAMSK